jgi:hypothetical protein
MKSLVTSLLTVSIVIFAVCAGPAEAAILRLSDYSSEDESKPYLAEYLDAELSFSVADSTLTLSVTNLTPENEGDPAFKMSRIYFNVADNVESLALTDVYASGKSAAEGWDLYFWEDGFLADGFGRFDVYLEGGQGSHGPVVEPGQTVSFVFQISGDGPFVDSDFVTLSSLQGGHIASYAAAKFYNDCTSAYGATNVPEPATVFLLSLGCLVFLRGRP